MTKTEAAIALKMPMSGDPEIDAIILAARKLDLMLIKFQADPYAKFSDAIIFSDTMIHYAIKSDS
jgi:hypothetical protein